MPKKEISLREHLSQCGKLKTPAQQLARAANAAKARAQRDLNRAARSNNQQPAPALPVVAVEIPAAILAKSNP